MKLQLKLTLVLLICFISVQATDYYVAINGNDNNPGTISEPFATLEYAFVTIAKPGDIIYMRGGTYHEEISISEKTGPITITNYDNEVVTLDGSESLSDLGGSIWTQEPGTNIYKTTINKDIWQLWIDERMMIVARWPNVTVGHPCDPIQFKSDGYTPVDNSWWDKEGTWGHMTNAWNSTGDLTNDPSFHDLSTENASFAGGSVILNFHSESTFSRNILSHTTGSNNLVHEPVMNPHDKRQGHFIIEANNALDMPGEWYYNKETGEVRVWCEYGQSPEGFDVRGKTISYAISVDEMTNITVKGINFFGCTINSSQGKYVTVEDCNFSYPTWYKRILGEHNYSGEPSEASTQPPGEGATIFEGKTGEANGTYTTLKNCIFEYSDGPIWMKSGYGVQIDNCMFRYFSFTGMAQMVLMANSNKNSLIKNCTFHTNGSKVMLKHTSMDVTMCHFSYFGYFQFDGVAMQCAGGNGAGGGSDGRVRSFNWHHHAFKGGCRWDGNSGINGTDHHLVSWRVPASTQIKGNYHHVINNTSVDMHDSTAPAIKVLDCGGTRGNTESNVHNNLSSCITSDRSSYVSLTGNHSSNWNWAALSTGTDNMAKHQIRDAKNWDFRPRAGSEIIDAGIVYESITNGYFGDAPDIGAYEYGDENYWIPGRMEEKACTPIPPNNATDVKIDADLMWLKGREATEFRVYFGTNPCQLSLVTTQYNNIYHPRSLSDGQTYFWRIDCVTPNGIVKGDTWNFLVGSALTDINSEDQNPYKFNLYDNYPNPFNSQTVIKYSIPKASPVKLKIYNILGELVMTLVDKSLIAGNYQVNMDSNAMASGVYLYRLVAGNKICVKKLVLIK